MNNPFDVNDDMPIGLRMALTQNLNALTRFSNLSPMQQQSFIQGAHHVGSKQEMHAYVSSLLQRNG